MTPKTPEVNEPTQWTMLIVAGVACGLFATFMQAIFTPVRYSELRHEAREMSKKLHQLELALLEKKHQQQLTSTCNSCAAKARAAAAVATNKSSAALVPVPQRVAASTPVTVPIGETTHVTNEDLQRLHGTGEQGDETPDESGSQLTPTPEAGFEGTGEQVQKPVLRTGG